MATPAEIQVILDGPSLVAPPGATYQFENPPNIRTLSFSIAVIFLAVALLAFLMRMYTKWWILHKLSKDDYFLLVGMALFVAYIGIAIKIVTAGAGTHQWDIQVKNIKQVLYYIKVDEAIYGFNAPMIKVSILLQYLGIFQQLKKTTFLYIGCWVTIWICVFFYGVAVFLTIFSCTPRSKFWNPLLTTGHCLNDAEINIATGCFNLVSDFVLVLLPQHEIWKLQISPRQKLGVSGVFLIALSACVTSAMRLYYSIKLNQTSDVSYNIALIGSTSMAEISIGIICCCLPVSPRFFQVVIAPKFQSLVHSSFWTKTRSRTSVVSQSIRPRSIGGSKLDGKRIVAHDLPLHGTYETLEGQELQHWRVKESDVASRVVNFQHGIRMTHEITIEGSPAQGTELDLEGQQRLKSRELGW